VRVNQWQSSAQEGLSLVSSHREEGNCICCKGPALARSCRVGSLLDTRDIVLLRVALNRGVGLLYSVKESQVSHVVKTEACVRNVLVSNLNKWARSLSEFLHENADTVPFTP
jgi:hypothetical protein